MIDLCPIFFVSFWFPPPIVLQCPPSADKVPYCAEEWTPATAGLQEWDASEKDVNHMKQTLFLYNQDKPSYSRWAGD